ncbi:hypothetical protein [Mammaliicoccus sciuri]|uniref:hypothetical protein n=1 Tax=Mammaliicoccus sciuri TaxID=1296 RepID=UPI000E69886B|nr:hypothetical protein [Mammaliicoccus sciuri]RIN92412.1 hypothetical protein BU003_02165 [Mammaliicoccus sciuri]
MKIMIDWIKNRKLNNTSTCFFCIAFVISIGIPYIIVILRTFNILQPYDDIILTIIPTILSGILIPIYKFISFRQNVDDSLAEKQKTSVDYLKEKFINDTESFLLLFTSFPLIIYITYYIAGYMMSDKDRSSRLIIFLSVVILIFLIVVTIKVIKFIIKFIKKFIRKMKVIRKMKERKRKKKKK